jgi:ABC-type bacteriocin/lantibiotic exporter with double-glycine peptidase domain
MFVFVYKNLIRLSESPLSVIQIIAALLYVIKVFLLFDAVRRLFDKESTEQTEDKLIDTKQYENLH